MKTLGNLSPAKGSNKTKKRLGRGVGSGLGKTAGKGHKGQKARKSSDVPAGFEGGQVPLYRRLPKRGFTNVLAKAWEAVQTGSLKVFASGTQVNNDSLFKKGLISSPSVLVKLIDKGDLKIPLNISVGRASKGALEKVKSAGGSVELSSPKVEKKRKKKTYKF